MLTYPHVRPIVRWTPHPRLPHERALITPAELVSPESLAKYTFTLDSLIADMWTTLHAANGVGLAAPQLGIGLQLAVIKVGETSLVLINPRIVEREGTATLTEGCLSLPGLRTGVKRAHKVTFTTEDHNHEPFVYTVEGMLARAVQHETDHLIGELYPARLSSLKRGMIERCVRKMIKRGRW